MVALGSPQHQHAHESSKAAKLSIPALASRECDLSGEGQHDGLMSPMEQFFADGKGSNHILRGLQSPFSAYFDGPAGFSAQQPFPQHVPPLPLQQVPPLPVQQAPPMPLQQPMTCVNQCSGMPVTMICSSLDTSGMPMQPVMQPVLQPVLQHAMQPLMQPAMQPQNPTQIWVPYLAGPATGMAPMGKEFVAVPSGTCTANAAAVDGVSMGNAFTALPNAAFTSEKKANTVVDQSPVVSGSTSTGVANAGSSGTRAEDHKCPAAVFVDLSYLKER